MTVWLFRSFHTSSKPLSIALFHLALSDFQVITLSMPPSSRHQVHSFYVALLKASSFRLVDSSLYRSSRYLASIKSENIARCWPRHCLH